MLIQILVFIVIIKSKNCKLNSRTDEKVDRCINESLSLYDERDEVKYRSLRMLFSALEWNAIKSINIVFDEGSKELLKKDNVDLTKSCILRVLYSF